MKWEIKKVLVGDTETDLICLKCGTVVVSQGLGQGDVLLCPVTSLVYAAVLLPAAEYPEIGCRSVWE